MSEASFQGELLLIEPSSGDHCQQQLSRVFLLKIKIFTQNPARGGSVW